MCVHQVYYVQRVSDCAQGIGKQKTFDKYVNHVHVQYVYSRLACTEKRNIGNKSNVQYVRPALDVLRTIFIADSHTEKRNIGNESSVLGKRLRVFFTKGEKLELPRTSKSLVPQHQSFFSIPRFGQHRFYFSFLISTYQLVMSCGVEEIFYIDL